MKYTEQKEIDPTWNKFYVIGLLYLLGCQAPVVKQNIYDKVDQTQKELKSQTKNIKFLLDIDHSRLAANENVYTPPAIVTFFSNSSLNTGLIQIDPLIGLDLPFKILCYSEPDTQDYKLAYTSADFIAKRHQIPEDKMVDYSNQMQTFINGIPEANISRTSTEQVGFRYGMIQIKSDYGFDTTIIQLKKAIMSQGDTKWFGEVDYQKEAIPYDIHINHTTLLLFGGPGPGGIAMHDSPKLGLDAFCQKLLIYENEMSEVFIAYNDIEVFANLYYGRSTKPQKVINERLEMTFEKAVKK
jgi:uncharacterized protein (DUF302 family)